MSTMTIFLFAMFVFGLMIVGLVLTMMEFNRLTDEPSLRKGDGSTDSAEEPTRKATVRIVQSSENAA